MAFGDFTVVRSTVKNVLNSSGVLAEVAINTPAFEFNADGSYKGLLVEPAGTNRALYSSDFGNAAWSLYFGTSISTTEIAPDGTATATKIRMGTGDQAILRQSIAGLTNGTQLSLSLFIKQVSGTTGFLDISDKRGAVDITPTSEWVRYSITDTWNSSLPIIDLEFRGTSGVAEVLIWGAQLETGEVATSYIPTVASTVTRTADDITLASASSLIGQSEGVLYVEVDWRRVSGTNQILFEVNDTTANNRVVITVDNLSSSLIMAIISNGVLVTFEGQSFSGYSGIIKIAFAYAANDCALYKDGVQISADTSVDLSSLATLTGVNLGADNDGLSQANMWIRSVALFPTRLSNAQLASLTTL
jgi:hypothetical protein